MLGPVEVLAGATAVALGGPRPRTLLATLLVRAGRDVGRDELIRELWGSVPPRTAVDTLHIYVSRLRRALAGGPVAIRTRRGGYGAEVDPAGLDVTRFGALVRRGQDALGRGAATEAAEVLRSALGLWRADAYADIVRGPVLDAEVRRLQEVRATVLEDRIDAELACGRVAALVAELEDLTRRYPLRERLHAQRMLALYRVGRQADALDVFRQARSVLVDELGVEPGPVLRDLQRLILAQDATLLGRGAAPGVQPVAVAGPLRAGNLPQPLQPDVGRDHDVDDLAGLLRTNRLVTLTGLPGSGRTTLALAAARRLDRELPDGAWYVRAGASDDVGRRRRIADTLRVIVGARPDALTEALRDRVALLVLDDVVGAEVATLVDDLLQGSRSLRVLVVGTGRTGLSYERPHQVPPLALPDRHAPTGQQLRSTACRFLLDQLRRRVPGFAVDDVTARELVRIVHALDGHPTALAIAAECAEVSDLATVASIAASSPTGLVSPRRHGDAPAGVGDLVEAGLRSLDPAARPLLRALAVFDGGFTAEAAHAVAGGAVADGSSHGGSGPEAAADVASALDVLVTAGVVVPEATSTGIARFRVLDLLRPSLQAELTPATRRVWARRHARHLRDVADQAGRGIVGREQVHWLNRLHEEQANLVQAVRWFVADGDPIPAARVVCGAWRLWAQFGHHLEGDALARAVHDALEVAPSGPSPELSPAFLYGASRLASACGDHARARRLLHDGHAAAVRDGDPAATALCLAGLVATALDDDELPAARAWWQHARRAAGATADPWVVATVTQVEARLLAHTSAGDALRAFAAAEQAYREIGDEWSACLARLDAARLASRDGDVAAAASLHRANLERTIDLTLTTFDFVGIADDIRGLSALAERAGQPRLARELQSVAAVVQRTGPLAQVTADPRDLLRHALEESRALVP